MRRMCLLVSIMMMTATIAWAENTKKNLKDEAASESTTDESPLTGNFAITSNYLFRGVTQTSNLPAFQGGLTYTFLSTGLYGNLWGSNVDQLAPDGSRATVEIDTIVGINKSLTDNLSFNLSVGKYFYPKAKQLEYVEGIGTVTYYFLTGLIAHSANEFGSHAPGTYYNLATNVEVPARYVYFNDVTVGAAVGHFALPKAAGNSYNDYALTLSKKMKNYVLALQWTDTNHRYTNDSSDHAHIVATVTANF